MFVCMSDRPKEVLVCMYVWGSWACMYVCLTQSYKISVFRRVSNSLSKPFKIWRLIHFFWIVRGGTSQSLARLQTCMYVCLSSRPTLSMYVCMYVCTSDRPKQVCMYVWGLLSMYVCMSQAAELVCMYVWDSWASMYVCLKQLSVYVCYVLSVYVCFKYVCMSQRAKIYVCMDVSDIHT